MSTHSGTKKRGVDNIVVFLLSLVLVLGGLLGSIVVDLTAGYEIWTSSPLWATALYLLREVSKVLFITGAVTILIQYFFRWMDKRRREESQQQLDESLGDLKSDVRHITGQLASHVRSLDTMITDGIVEIHKSRQAAKAAVAGVLEDTENYSLDLIGISCRDFLKDDRLFAAQWERIKTRLRDEDNPGFQRRRLQIRILLVNPVCQQAVYRARSEQPDDRPHREHNLFVEVGQIITQMDHLIRELGGHNGNEAPVLQLRLYDTSPGCQLMISDKRVFVEQYHYRDRIKLGNMPLIQYDGSSIIGREMRKHFEFTWNNAVDYKYYFARHNIGVCEGVTGAGVTNIYYDRTVLTKRLRYLLESTEHDISIMGISLQSFVTAGSFLIQHISSDLKSDRVVRLALINPLCPQARYRAAKESNQALSGYTLEKHKTTRLYNDTIRSIADIERLSGLDYKLTSRLYSCAPSGFLFITSESALVEQYHYGLPPIARRVRDTVLSREVPVIEYGKDSRVYQLMTDHFDYVWNECSMSADLYKDDLLRDLASRFDEAQAYVLSESR